MGALVKIDGAEVGRTLVIDHPVTNGTHSIELILGEERVTEQITHNWRVAISVARGATKMALILGLIRLAIASYL